jgi:hypothetical protein
MYAGCMLYIAVCMLYVYTHSTYDVVDLVGLVPLDRVEELLDVEQLKELL